MENKAPAKETNTNLSLRPKNLLFKNNKVITKERNKHFLPLSWDNTISYGVLRKRNCCVQYRGCQSTILTVFKTIHVNLLTKETKIYQLETHRETQNEKDRERQRQREREMEREKQRERMNQWIF